MHDNHQKGFRKVLRVPWGSLAWDSVGFQGFCVLNTQIINISFQCYIFPFLIMKDLVISKMY